MIVVRFSMLGEDIVEHIGMKLLFRVDVLRSFPPGWTRLCCVQSLNSLTLKTFEPTKADKFERFQSRSISLGVTLMQV